MSMTKDQLKAGLATVQAVAEAIRELKRVPSGHPYAHLMGTLSLEQYNKVIGLLEAARLIERTPSHELIWLAE